MPDNFRINDEEVVARSALWVRASKSGILRTKVLLGDRVNPKDRMGIVADPFGENEENIHSPATGIVIGRTNMPLIHEGDAVFHIARLDSDAFVEATLQEFQEEISRQFLET